MHKVVKCGGENPGFWVREVQDEIPVLPPLSHLIFEIFLLDKVRTVVTLMGFCEGKWIIFTKCIVGLRFLPYLICYLLLSLVPKGFGKLQYKDGGKCWNPEVFAKLKSIHFSLILNFPVKILYHWICGFLITSFLKCWLLAYVDQWDGWSSSHWRLSLTFYWAFSEAGK